ncbi:MAG: PadR family transcriptional regulator [Dehalococcoidia bacterium]|jgi:DNA-binding PadR family transcriptional regulator|nr:PadR family transcriptional regulator [Dehalococcoidia bacterium]
MHEEIYWENLVKRSLCRFFLLAELARGPVHGYRINQAIQEACQGCCEPTEAMVYSTLKEMMEGGYVECQDETYGGRQRRMCSLTPAGLEAFQAAGRVWQKMLPEVQRTVAQALAPTIENSELVAIQ